jgi:organic radical activating enzyme
VNYSLNVTYDCNWNCDYCIIDTHNKPKRKFEKVLKDIDSIPEKSNVSLGGGEPGMLEYDDICKIVKKLKDKKCNIDLLTNGLFIKKYINTEIMNDIDTIHYHCVEDLKDDIEFINIPYKDVDYIIIITNDNYKYLESFLNKYPNIMFSITPSMNVKPLNKKIMFQIIKKYKHRMTERSIKEFFYCACEGVRYIG